jgi:quinol monooxygenase YgiN
MIVRISRGSFDPQQYASVAAALSAAQESLIPAIRALDGVLSYYAAIDRTAASMVNVSIWSGLEQAQQMATLAPMLALREVFEANGVRFEPIINYETVWTLDGSASG